MMLRWGTADSEKILADHGDWLALADGETIEFAAKTRRDLLILTDRRVVRTDTQGFSFTRKTEYMSIPYRSISRWSVESRGKAWLDGADLKLWISAATEPILDIELQKDAGARDVATLLARHAI